MVLDKLINYIQGAQTTSAAYTPSKPYTGSLPTSTVKKGYRNTNVKHVQTFLNWCINAKLSVDGYCGKLTKAAIVKWQKQYKSKGILADGVFGAKSIKVAKEIVAKYAKKTTPVKTTTLADKILSACKTQAIWMKDYTYKWESNPTVAKSRYRGTCVTYVACVLQRIGYLASGKYIWHNTSGKAIGTTDKMTVLYPNKTISAYKGSLKAGDIVMAGSKSNVGSGSHIFVFNGTWSGTNPYVWDNHSATYIKKGKSGLHTYSGSKRIIAVIRLK